MRKFLFVLCVTLISNLYGQNSEPMVKSKINFVEKDEFLYLRGYVENSTLVHVEGLSYTFLALKKSLSGDYSSEKNEGSFNLKPREVLSVSEISVLVREDEELKVYLFIRDEEKLISKDSLNLVPKKFLELQKSNIMEEELVLKGIVVDELLTKFGKDYHDKFYQQYRLSGNLYPFIITLREKPYFGSSSLISVFVEDEIIHEFFVSRTNDEFLDNVVRTSLVNLNRYANRRENQRGKIVKY